MARSTKAKAQKGRNGVGDSLTVYFDCSDPAERKALEAARLLATKHGRRKQAIIALLEAVYNCYEQTGELMSASEISTALHGKNVPVPQQQKIFAGTDAKLDKRRPQHRDNSPFIEITNAAGTDSNQTITKNFMASMTGVASGFFD
jgi:hypothetical protein